MTKLIQLTQKELKQLRKEQLKKQGNKCAILKIKIDEFESVMDHKHKTKDQECGGPEGLGCLRGVLHRNANSFEGKLERAWKRYGLSDVISLPQLLRNCADFIESPPMKPYYIHPTERPKSKPPINKIEYKRICKFYFVIYPRKKKLPAYPQRVNSGEKILEWLGLKRIADELNKKKMKDFTEEEKYQIKRAQKTNER